MNKRAIFIEGCGLLKQAAPYQPPKAGGTSSFTATLTPKPMGGAGPKLGKPPMGKPGMGMAPAMKPMKPMAQPAFASMTPMQGPKPVKPSFAPMGVQRQPLQAPAVPEQQPLAKMPEVAPIKGIPEMPEPNVAPITKQPAQLPAAPTAAGYPDVAAPQQAAAASQPAAPGIKTVQSPMPGAGRSFKDEMAQYFQEPPPGYKPSPVTQQEDMATAMKGYESPSGPTQQEDMATAMKGYESPASMYASSPTSQAPEAPAGQSGSPGAFQGMLNAGEGLLRQGAGAAGRGLSGAGDYLQGFDQQQGEQPFTAEMQGSLRQPDEKAEAAAEPQEPEYPKSRFHEQLKYWDSVRSGAPGEATSRGNIINEKMQGRADRMTNYYKGLEDSGNRERRLAQIKQDSDVPLSATEQNYLDRREVFDSQEDQNMFNKDRSVDSEAMLQEGLGLQRQNAGLGARDQFSPRDPYSIQEQYDARSA